MEKPVYSDNFEESITLNTSSVWIGDPCYVLKDELYASVVDHDDYDNGILSDGNTQFGLVHHTMYGDGAYPASSGCYYGVDSGSIAILDGKFADGSLVDKGVNFNLEEGEHTITLSYKNGEFTFIIDGNEVESVRTFDDYDDCDGYEHDCEDEDDYEDDDDPDEW